MIHEPVKVAVIGCGGYAFQLIKRIQSVPHSGTVAAATSRDTSSPGAQYCRNDGIPVFETIEELLDYGKFEVVLNPTPIHLHTATTKQCLDAGFPVWLEKPPVATVQELDYLQAEAEAAGKPIAVCFNSLFSYLNQRLKRDLVTGRFGRVEQIKAMGAWIRTTAYFNRNGWAGRLYKDGQWILDGDVNNPFAHVLCNNLYFAGAEQHVLADPVEVQAELYRCNEIETEDTSCLRVRTSEGVEIIDYLTLGTHREIPPRTVIKTEEALITFEDFQRLKIEFKNGLVEHHEAYQENRIEMIEHLCRAFRTGEPYYSTLDRMRPFTVAVNSAFDSAGSIRSVPQEFVESGYQAGAKYFTVSGIEETMEKAFESNALYSEMGVPWAHPSEVFDARNYREFPVQFTVESPAAAGRQSG